MKAGIENPDQDDLTIESDLRFREILGAGHVPMRIAASRNFALVQGMKSLLEEEWDDEDDEEEDGSETGEVRGWTAEDIADQLSQDLPDHEVSIGIHPNRVAIEGEGENIVYSRMIELADNDVYHANCSIMPSGAGLGKVLFRNQLAMYLDMQLARIGTNCQEVGVYAWAKYGFNAPDYYRKNWLNTMFFAFDAKPGMAHKPREKGGLPDYLKKSDADSGGPGIPLTTPSHMAYIAVVWLSADMLAQIEEDFKHKSYKPWEDKDFIVDDDGSFLLGKHTFLVGYARGWSGILTLADGSLDRQILEDYIEY